MSSRKIWPVVLMFLLANSCLARSLRQTFRVSTSSSLTDRAQHLWRAPIHNSEFAEVPHTSARSRCERTHPPEALTTPNPLLGPSDPSVKVRVSFIVGADGRVHSPLILESAGTSEDHTILETVRSWRYRPAMCNGVPTETEGKIEFSSR
jgi:TonB family protein